MNGASESVGLRLSSEGFVRGLRASEGFEQGFLSLRPDSLDDS